MMKWQSRMMNDSIDLIKPRLSQFEKLLLLLLLFSYEQHNYEKQQKGNDRHKPQQTIREDSLKNKIIYI